MDNSDFKVQLLNRLLPDNIEEPHEKDSKNQKLKKLINGLFWFIVCFIFWIPLIIVIYSLSRFFTDKNILDFCDLCSLYIFFFFFLLTVLILLIPLFIIIRSGLKNFFSNELSKNEYKKYVLGELINLHKHEKEAINLENNNLENRFSMILEENNKKILKQAEDYIDNIKENEYRWNQIQTSLQSILDLLNKQH